MSLPAIYLPDAQDDVDGAYSWYEQQLASLGERFLDALRERVDRICDFPEAYGVIYQDVRAAPLKRFPYVVYYRVEVARIVIIAVQHGRRSSRAWQRRV